MNGQFVFTPDLIADIKEETTLVMLAETDIDPRLFGGVKIEGIRPSSKAGRVECSFLHVCHGSIFTSTSTIEPVEVEKHIQFRPDFSRVATRQNPPRGLVSVRGAFRQAQEVVLEAI
jgi:hypothetical protein